MGHRVMTGLVVALGVMPAGVSFSQLHEACCEAHAEFRSTTVHYGVVDEQMQCRAPVGDELAAVRSVMPSGPQLAEGVRMVSVGRSGAARGARSVGLDVQFALAPEVNDPDFINGLEIAAQHYESIITDNVVVVMSVGFVSGQGFIAATSRFASDFSYSNVRDALVNDASPEESAIVGLLPLSPPLGFDYGFGIIFEPGISQPEDNINVPFAQAQAMGLGDLSGPGELDSAIVFNTDFAFDSDPTDGLTPGFVDVVFVMVHELGHAMGFVSSADAFPNDDPDAEFDRFFFFPSAWDLFRVGSEGFANDPDTLVEWSAVNRVMESGARAAVDSVGQYPLIEASYSLSTGQYVELGGDGRQASHWRDQDLEGRSMVIGVMDPTFDPSTIDLLNPLSDADLLAFSLMGWDIDLPFADIPGGECEGDANGDGMITIADVLFIIARFGDGAASPGNVNGDGAVTIADVLFSIARFGNACN